MLQNSDFTSSINERKSVRKELKQKPSVASAIKQAAAMVGMDESTFINSAAFQRAQEIMQSQFVTILDEQAFTQFANALEAPAKASPALSDAMKRSGELFKNG